MRNQKPQLANKASVYLSVCVAAALSQSHTAMAATAAGATDSASSDQGLEELVVTGYRKSLSDSTNFKKESLGFADGIFAEDMGKFPDNNAAESFNRIPGINISRDMFGEGVQVAIRGLPSSFTNVLMNDAPIMVASSTDDGQNQDRQVDLDMMPTQFFTQLTVAKTPDASMIEGGAAGTINMRQLRPFDNPGPHVSASVQGTKMSAADKVGERGTIVASDTWGDFGVLVGLAGLQNQVNVSSYETIGWTNAGLSTAQCGTLSPCNATGSGNWTIPGTVPAGAGNGLTTGATIDNAFLLANNPGLTTQQIDNAIIPRLGRNVSVIGKQERINSSVSLQWNPSDELHFYIDSLYGRKHNTWNRIDFSWIGRSGSSIPLDMTVDRSDCSNGCVVTGGQFANAQVNLEFRPYIEDTQFVNVNPGLEWKITDKLKYDMQFNDSHGTFHRQVPSVLVDSALGTGVTVNYVNNGSTPSFTATQNGQPFDFNNPANFGWNGSAGGRVNIQDEFRSTNAKGVRGNLMWGDASLNLKAGYAYDDTHRTITGFDNSQYWQNAVCGDNPNVQLPSPNTQPPCQGLSTATPGAGYPTYPGLGTNYTATGYPALVYQGSLIPNSAISNYLQPGPAGFVTVNWPAFANASNYYAFHANEPRSGGSNTGASGGYVEEKVTGLYTELNGDSLVDGKHLRYSVGVRWVHTKQIIGGVVSLPDPRDTVIPAAPAIACNVFARWITISKYR